MATDPTKDENGDEEFQEIILNRRIETWLV
jgi:hypothetical protein